MALPHPDLGCGSTAAVTQDLRNDLVNPRKSWIGHLAQHRVLGRPRWTYVGVNRADRWWMTTANRIVPEIHPSFGGVEGSSGHLKSTSMKLRRRSFACRLAMISTPILYWIAGDTHCQLLCGGTKYGMEKRGKTPSNTGRPNPVSKVSVQGDRCLMTHRHPCSV